MSQVFNKLQLKDHTEILVTNAPQSFEAELSALPGVSVKRTLDEVAQVGFALVFVTTQAELDAVAQAIGAKTSGDPVVWFAYPKGTSRNYTCDIRRDDGWDALGRCGFEAVTMVSIDDDWTAKRYRQAAYIKTMTRDPAWVATDIGREKVAASQAMAKKRPVAKARPKKAAAKKSVAKKAAAKKGSARKASAKRASAKKATKRRPARKAARRKR